MCSILVKDAGISLFVFMYGVDSSFFLLGLVIS